jgi:hypothetical protein
MFAAYKTSELLLTGDIYKVNVGQGQAAITFFHTDARVFLLTCPFYFTLKQDGIVKRLIFK